MEHRFAKNPEELPQLFAERVNAGDLNGLLALYEEGAEMAGPGGASVTGTEAILAQLEGLLAMEPEVSASEPRVLRAGDIALLSNSWRMHFGEAGAGTGGLRGSSTEVARITLNRPERHNALSMRLSDELMQALEQVRGSEQIKVVVIAGAGETFCAGDDITEMGLWGDANQIVRRVRGYQRMADTLAGLDKVSIAAVDGYAVGGGLEITMACDFVIATRRSKWGMPEVDVGITPGWGGTTRMARLIGRRMTKEVNLLGALHPAARAAELGLWNRVVEDDQLGTEVDALVEVVLAKNQQAVRQLKFIIDNGVEADLQTAQGFEALSAGLSGAVNGAWQVPDADQAAGIVSFISNGDRWRERRDASRGFWSDGPLPDPVAEDDRQ